MTKSVPGIGCADGAVGRGGQRTVTDGRQAMPAAYVKANATVEQDIIDHHGQRRSIVTVLLQVEVLQLAGQAADLLEDVDEIVGAEPLFLGARKVTDDPSLFVRGLDFQAQTTYPDFEVVVVNDRSGDRTEEGADLS